MGIYFYLFQVETPVHSTNVCKCLLCLRAGRGRQTVSGKHKQGSDVGRQTAVCALGQAEEPVWALG